VTIPSSWIPARQRRTEQQDKRRSCSRNIQRTKGDTSNTEYKTSLRKPRQQKPDKKSWKVWTKVLSYITKGSNTLKNDLRKWTEAHIDAGTWKSYYSTDNNRVMRFENDL